MDESKAGPGIEQEPKKSKELERKFKILRIPEDLENYPPKEIRQGYLSISEDGSHVRLRDEEGDFTETFKSANDPDSDDKGERDELQIELTDEQFDVLWPGTEGKRLHKFRHKIPYKNHTIELDIFIDDLEGLMIAEVEFNTREEKSKFEKPDWFGEEVTDDPRYYNQELSTKGKPDEPQVRVDRKEEEDISVPEFEKDEGIARIVASVNEQLKSGVEPVIVEIAGGSASGKTSAIASKVKEAFGEDAVIYSMDDYYRGRKFMDAEEARGNKMNWDQPEAVNIELFREHLLKLKAGETIDKPVYSMMSGEVEGAEDFPPKKVIIVEGLFALNDQIKDVGDVKAFVDIGFHGRVLRRILRDIERTGQSPEDILRYMSEVVEDMHDRYIQSTKKNADLVVKNEYNPKVEAKKSGLHEIQVKYRLSLSPEDLRSKGVERLTKAIQLDHYYNPGDRDLTVTDEMLRIRDEAESRILTYKGPRIQGVSFRERPKFEFEIDRATEHKFLEKYGDKIKTVQKHRTFYRLDEVIFSIDSVSKIEGKDTVEIGEFIEFRMQDSSPESQEKLAKVIKKLQITEEPVLESYSEM